MSIVLRHKDEDGVEFFTLDFTGESGMSISGLAKLCGKPRMTVYDAVQKAVDGISKAEHLKSLRGKAIQLTVGSSYKNVSVIKDEVCAAVIKHYAFGGSKKAQYALDRFTEKGVRAWIQENTGWGKSTIPTPSQNFPAFPEVPRTFAEALRLAASLADENQKLLSEVREVKTEKAILAEEVRWSASTINEYQDTNQYLLNEVNAYKPKADDYDLLEKREGFISGQELVKRLAVKSFSVRKLYDLLREKRILFKAKGETLNQPYQRYIDNGWIKVRDVACPDGKKRPAPVFSWKAVVKIIKLMKITGWISQDCEVFNWDFSEDEFMKSAEPESNVIELRRA